MMRALCLQIPPHPPAFFSDASLFQSTLAIESHHASMVFANGGGGGCAPPQPLRFSKPFKFLFTPPPPFLAMQACFKTYECLKAIMRALCWLRPPQPPRPPLL